MNRAEWQELEKAEISEENNPYFLLATISSELISKIAKGEINVQEVAKRTLEDRNLDIDLNWVGFGKEIK